MIWSFSLTGYQLCEDKIQMIPTEVFCLDTKSNYLVDSYYRHGLCVDGSVSREKCFSDNCPQGTYDCPFEDRCISLSLVCDDINHCWDESDEAEELCETWNCTRGFIKFHGGLQ